MSDRWYYRIYGQDFGPVSLELVRSLVASGTIAPDDEVRDATRSNWLLACAATELRDSIKPESTSPLIERRLARDEWYCRGAAGDFGPLKLVDLIQLAAQGHLAADEEIKAKADDYWKQVTSFQRLVDLLPFPEKHCREKAIRAILYAHQEQVSTYQRRPTGALTEPQCDDDGDLEMDVDPDEEPSIIRFPGIQTYQTAADSNDFLSGEPDGDDSLITYEQLAKDRPATTFSDSLKLNSVQTSTFGNFAQQDGPAIIKMQMRQDVVQSNDFQWSGWIGGKEFGPVEYSQLLTWAVTGELSPTDFIRRGTQGQFVPAVTIPWLFTVRTGSVSPSQRMSTELRTDSSLTATLDGSAISKPVSNSNLVAKEQKPLANAGHHASNSILREMAADPTSIGVSALLTIALIVVGWIACH